MSVKKNRPLYIITILILLIIVLFIVFNQKGNEKKVTVKQQNPKIISNLYLDFENAIINGGSVVSNDQNLVAQDSIDNVNVEIDKAREGDKSISLKLAPKEGRKELRVIDIPNNTTKYIGFSVYFPKETQIPTSWNLFAQWWQGAPASPPIAFEITPETNDFKMRILTRSGPYEQNNIKVQYNESIEKEKWIDFVIEMRVDDSGGLNGILNVWKDSKQIVNYKGALGYPNLLDKTNFRFGLYRHPSINSPIKIYFDNIMIGDRLKK